MLTEAPKQSVGLVRLYTTTVSTVDQRYVTKTLHATTKQTKIAHFANNLHASGVKCLNLASNKCSH